jgi:hypothetical protein
MQSCEGRYMRLIHSLPRFFMPEAENDRLGEDWTRETRPLLLQPNSLVR